MARRRQKKRTESHAAASAEQCTSGQQDVGSAQAAYATEPVDQGSRAWSGRNLLLLSVTILAVLIAYLPALHGDVLWDDDAHLTRPALHSFAGLYRIWFELGATQQFYPLLHSAFWLENRVWGGWLVGYHLVNVAWHCVATLLVYFNLRKLRVPGAVLAAAIFALHPVMVESVAWISEQKNTLSAVFYLASMRAYFEFVDRRARSWYAFSLGLFVLGLLTKTVVATLPAALLVIFWWQRGAILWRRDIAPLVPFFVLGATGGVLTAWIEHTLIGAHGAEFSMSFWARLALSGRVVWFYLSKLLWPANLTFIYPRWEIYPGDFWQWRYSATAIAVTAIVWLVRKRTRAPLAAWLYFCGTLFPALGFLNVYPFIYSFVADHFQYLASLGPIVLFSAGVWWIAEWHSPFIRQVVMAACVALVGILAVLTWRQSHLYADSVALYEATIERNPGCWMAHHNLGLSLASRGDEEAAMEQYRKSLELNPTLVDAHSNLGLLLTHADRLTEAVSELNTALELEPNYPDALNNLGIALVRMGRFEKAIEKFKKAVEIRPEFPMALNNLGTAYYRLHRVAAAVEQYKLAVEEDPYYADAHKNLGIALVETGELDAAIEHFEQAVQLQPNFAAAHLHLADALRRKGEFTPAMIHYRAALQTNPDFIQAYAGLMQTQNLANQPEEVVATARKAIEVARSTGQQEAASQVEEWLEHYETELRRSGNGAESRESGVKAE